MDGKELQRYQQIMEERQLYRARCYGLPAETPLDGAFDPHVSAWQGHKRAEMHIRGVGLMRRIWLI